MLEGEFMRSRRKHNSAALMAKAAELACFAPQVAAHRMLRMAKAGSSLTARDRREFQRMHAEKTAAFIESWNAMALEAFRVNQALTASFLHSFWGSWRQSKPSSGTAMQWHNASLRILGKGMGPVHRRAVANAKRLAGAKFR
jgi:hypothetical protein